MKKLTRILCLALCLIMLLPSIVACGEVDLSSGAQINMYLTSEVYNFDPAYAHLDSSAVKLLSLMYEGIMKLDDNGKVKKALCDTWEYVEDEGIDEESDEDNTYTMTITLKDSGWTDGRAVHADQFVYAWKRLLEPDFDGEGAELLYDIKGAWERKNMGLSPDDIGLYADQKVLTIEFKHSIDPDDFLRKLTSIALVPLRQDKVDYYHDWSKELKAAGSYEAFFAQGYSFDTPKAINLNLMKEHLISLKNGSAVRSPDYNFTTCESFPHGVLKKPSKIIVNEGLYVLNEGIRDIMDIKVYVFTPFEIIKDRWYRRAESRGKTGKAADMQFENVNTTAQTYIRPAMQCADIVMNGVVSSAYIQEMTEKIFRTMDNIMKKYKNV